jgi:hypothetical protein
LRVLSWTPPGGASNVPRDTVIRLVFDGYPDPDTVNLGGVIVTTGVFYNGGTYNVDLIEKTITFRAAIALRGLLGYNITVQPGLLSLHGCPAVMEQRSFRTSGTTSMPPPPPAPVVPFAEVQPIFARSCGGSTCHRAVAQDVQTSPDGCLATPAGGLSLCDRQARAALVDVPSRQVSRLDLVKRNDSARSYLLRKLLPGDTVDRPAPGALGHRDPPGAPLTTDELHAIARWIDAGANP